MISLLLLIYPVNTIIPTSSKEKESDELLYSATRYGPRTSCQRNGLREEEQNDRSCYSVIIVN